MRKIFLGAVLTLIIIAGLRYFENAKEQREQLQSHTALIEQQLKNVGKLIVTEGNYAQVFTYNDSKKYYVDLLSASKKALVVVNAEATVAYDLSKIETEIDPLSKTLRITFIPEPELKIYPDIKYYDVQQDYLNQFNAQDYNVIKQRVQKELDEKIKKSTLYTNAQNRLIAELFKIYVLTNSLEWTLQYNGNIVDDQNIFETTPTIKQ